MAHTVQFVDSVSATPTTLLDLNSDEFRCIRFDPHPPRLRKSISQNMLTNGGILTASSYDQRIIDVAVELVAGDPDAWAGLFQPLARILDAPQAIILYQRDGATNPVFLTTDRADIAEILEQVSHQTRDVLSFQLLAKPFGEGLAQTFSGTFTLDGASAGAFQVDLPTILGDVAAPLTVDVDLANYDGGFDDHIVYLGASAAPAATGITILDANGDFNAGTGTAGTTGAGSTYWNGDYMGATTSLTSKLTRIYCSPTLPASGAYRVWVRLGFGSNLAADTTLTISGRSSFTGSSLVGFDAGVIQDGDETVITQTFPSGATQYTIRDLGIFTFPFGFGPDPAIDMGAVYFGVQASLDVSAGAGFIRFDGLIFEPVESDAAGLVNRAAFVSFDGRAPSTPIGTADTLRLDSEHEVAYLFDSVASTQPPQAPSGISGGGLLVHPGMANKLLFEPAVRTLDVTDSVDYVGTYRPQYLHIRPGSS